MALRWQPRVPSPEGASWRYRDRERSCFVPSSRCHTLAEDRTAAGPISGVFTMRSLHTMLRVRNLDAALDFYCNKLGLKEVRRRVDEKGKFTLVFLAAPADDGLVAKGPATRQAPLVELTYNWDAAEDYGEARYFGHLAY